MCVCRFDAAVLATHSDISLSLLGAGATAEERAVLSAIPYNNNDIYLHTDEALMPVSECSLPFNAAPCCWQPARPSRPTAKA